MSDIVPLSACWEATEAWNPDEARQQSALWARRQPAAHALVVALLGKHDPAIVEHAIRLAVALDTHHRLRHGTALPALHPRLLDDALADSQRALASPPRLGRNDVPRLPLPSDIVGLDVFDAVLAIAARAEGDRQAERRTSTAFAAMIPLAIAYDRATRPARAKVGRNDPCPCGSGRKFKRCCGDQQAMPPLPEFGDTPGEQLFKEYTDLYRLIFAYLPIVHAERDGKWLETRNREFEKRFTPGKRGGIPHSLHVCWMVADLPLPTSGQTVIEQFIAREAHRLVEPAPTLLPRLAESYAAFYEVLALNAASGMKRLRELGTGAEWAVYDLEDPDAVDGAPGDVWLVRLVGTTAEAVTLSTPIIWPPDAKDQLERMAGRLIAEHGGPGDAIDARARRAFKHAMPVIAQFVVASFRAAEQGPVVLANTDGDPLAPLMLAFGITSADDAFAALANLDPHGPDDHYVERGPDGRITRASVRWSRVGGDSPLPSTLLATIHIAPDMMAVEVNSHERADAARAIIAERLGDRAEFREAREMPIEDALSAMGGAPAGRDDEQARLLREHPELREALAQHHHDYYQRWLDLPIPALGGKTPRQAVKTAASRRKLIGLLDEMEVHQLQRPEWEQGVDVAALRRELGLAG